MTTFKISSGFSADGSTITLGAGNVLSAVSAVTSVTAYSDGSLTISPTTGAAIARINLANANTWTGKQIFEEIDASSEIVDGTDSTKAITFSLSGATTMTVLTIVSAQTSTHNLTIPVLSGNDTLAALGVAQTFGAKQTFTGGMQFGTSTTAGYVLTASDTSGNVEWASVFGASSFQNTIASATALIVSSPPGGVTDMLGLGSAWYFTPAKYGNIVVTLDCNLVPEYSGGAYPTLAVAYGTGTAPANGDAATGTTSGATLNLEHISSGVILSLTRIITGLTVGTPYWLDLQVFRDILTEVDFSTLNVTVRELSN